MSDMVYFELTEQHVKLLRQANIREETYGGGSMGTYPSFDGKRPFGNSSVHTDVKDILYPGAKWMEDQEEFVWEGKVYSGDVLVKPYQELSQALQVVLSAGSFVPGRYESPRYSHRWKLA